LIDGEVLKMKYTAVFEWPEGEAPVVRKGEGWKGGELCAVSFSDALDELHRLREAAQHFCDNYLRYDHDNERRAAIVALLDALETTGNH
jgi:hypothetical protein